MKDLRFTIISPTLVDMVLENSPIGWDENFITLSRSKEYHGFFRSYSQSLKFVKEGAQRLREIFYNYAVATQGVTALYNSLAQLKIEKLDPVLLT
jgi:hypothetical protein